MSKRQRIPEGHQRFFFAIDKEDAIRIQIRARLHGLSRLKLFKRARNVTKELYINGIQESKNLGLSDEDKENIFDILENVSPFAD